MPRVLQVAALIVSVLVTTGCAVRMNVGSHQDHNLNLPRYRTFAWGPADALPTGDRRLDENAFFKDHVQGAVEKELARRGFELLSSGAPDLLIHYHANITKRIDVNRVDRGYGYCLGGECPPDVVDYEAGTLVLDIIDTHSNALIWRGWAQNSVHDMLDDPDRMAKTIDEAVRLMLLRLPAKQ
jgi:Domain of unknown function (DUF4136)